MRRGIPLVVSAPSGAGKSTLTRMLTGEFPRLRFSVSCTTRSMRAGEVEGEDYYFLSRTEFEKRRKNGQFAEWAQVHGNFYGTPLNPVREMMANGFDVLFDVDVQGAAQIRLALPQAKFLFILPPSIGELERRLHIRGQDDEESIRKRLANARLEIREALWYDAIIINEDLQKAYRDLKIFYQACSFAPACNADLLTALLGEE